MRKPALVLLSLFVVACEAPVVVPREAEPAPADAPPARRGEARLLQQVDAIRAELDRLETKPADVLSSIGTLYYQAGRYPDAIDWYRQSIEAAAPVLEARRTLLEAGVVPAGEVPPGCVYTGAPGAMQAALERARSLAGAGRSAEALACYDAALEPVVDAYARRGGSWQVLQRSDLALADLERALAIRPDDTEALYLYGTVVFQSATGSTDMALLRRAVERWQRLLAVAPDHPRAEQVRTALDEVEHLVSHRQAPQGPAPAVERGGTGG